MKKFRESMELLVQDACIFISKQPPEFREWRTVRRQGTNVLIAPQPKQDYSLALWRWGNTEVATQRPFDDLCEAVRAKPSLREAFLVDPYGEAVPEGDSQRSQINRGLVHAFVRTYINKYGGVFQDKAFNELLDSVLGQIQPGQISMIETNPLLFADIEPDEIIIEPGMRLRKTGADEIDGYLNHGYGMREDEVVNLRCALEVVSPRKPTRQLNTEESGKERRLITAIRLVAGGNPCVAFTTAKTSSLLDVGSQAWWSPFRPQYASTAIIHVPEIPILLNLYERLATSTNAKSVALALSRWNSGGDRSTDEDRLIDCWVGLESLFGPKDRQELSFRMALRIAAFLGADGKERQRIFSDMKDSYNGRSTIVHGSPWKNKKVNLSEVAASTRNSLKQALLKIILSDEQFHAEKLELGLLSREDDLHSNAEFEDSAGI